MHFIHFMLWLYVCCLKRTAYAWDSTALLVKIMDPFNLAPCDFHSVHEIFVMPAAFLSDCVLLEQRQPLWFQRVPNGETRFCHRCGQVILLLWKDHSDGCSETNCDCMQNGGITFISVNKETFSFTYIPVFFYNLFTLSLLD